MRLSGTKTSSIHQYRGLGDQLWDLGGQRPSLDLQFSATKNLVDSISGQSLVTFTRASSGTFVDGAGVLQTAGNDVPRFDHNPTTGESLGLLVEEQRTNSIRNNTMVGAVAGTPGALPTNWSQFLAPTGITRSVVGTGTENGINYVDVRFSGTASGAGELSLFPEASSTLLFAAGTTLSVSTWLSIVGGSTANISSIRQRILSYNVGTYLSEGQQTAALSSQLSRYTLNGYATAATSDRVSFGITAQCAAAGAIDITLRIGLPQLEQGAFATSVIPTSGTAATRSADVASITGANFSSWYRQDEGTVFAEWFGGPVAANKYPSIAAARQTSANNSQNTVEIFQGPSLTNVRANGLVRVLNVDQIARDSGDLTLVGTKVKAALGVRINDFAFSANGVQVGAVDTSGTPPTVDTLNIGFNSAPEQLNGRISRLTYWPARLSNSTLQTITQ